MLITPSLFGRVKFNLNFTDPENAGLNKPEFAWMKAAMNEAAESLGDTIAQNAQVYIEVISNNNIRFSMACSEFHTMPDGFRQIEYAHERIFEENDENKPQIFDGHIKINPEDYFSASEVKDMFIHELTHLLGYRSNQYADLTHSRSQNFQYNRMDTLLQDSKGEKLIKENVRNPKFDSSSGVFACGPNILKHNNQCIEMENFRVGALSHPKANNGDIMSYKNIYHTWNTHELGIMEDLHYKINYDTYCKEFKKFHYDDLNSKEILSLIISIQSLPEHCSLQPKIKDKYDRVPSICSIDFDNSKANVIVDKNKIEFNFTKKHIPELYIDDIKIPIDSLDSYNNRYSVRDYIHLNFFNIYFHRTETSKGISINLNFKEVPNPESWLYEELLLMETKDSSLVPFLAFCNRIPIYIFQEFSQEINGETLSIILEDSILGTQLPFISKSRSYSNLEDHEKYICLGYGNSENSRTNDLGSDILIMNSHDQELVRFALENDSVKRKKVVINGQEYIVRIDFNFFTRYFLCPISITENTL